MIVAPATFEDWLQLLAARGQQLATASDMAMLRQVLSGPAWSLRTAASIPPAALAGTVHAEHSVIWIATAPQAACVPVSLVKSLRALVEREARMIGRPLFANVDDSNAEGRRLVALLGFHHVGPHTWRRA